MASAFIPGLRASFATTIEKVRELPIAGKVLVKISDVVKASDPVLSADLPGNLHILRISEKLGIEPNEVITALKIQVGDNVKSGDILCEHSGLFGLFKSRFICTCTGVVEFISKVNGHIGVREIATPLIINAFVSGNITEIIDTKSVSIETEGAFVQGIFGVGGEKIGELLILSIPADKSLSEEDIPVNIKGKILVGATAPSIAAIRKAASAGAVGMIVGAIDDKALKSYLGYDLGVAITGDENLSMTLIITEGFGSLPISERVLSVLKKFNGFVASINGTTQVRAGAIRPEIIITHNQKEAQKDPTIKVGLDIGSKIRMIRVPYFGLYGSVTELPRELIKIETGAEARVLKARLEDGREVIVPRANVEIV
ncbi:MAG: hypothetical protein SGJ02_09190 [bacterium]|nr:hypothetical protein [bacterium]